MKISSNEPHKHTHTNYSINTHTRKCIKLRSKITAKIIKHKLIDCKLIINFNSIINVRELN